MREGYKRQVTFWLTVQNDILLRTENSLKLLRLISYSCFAQVENRVGECKPEAVIGLTRGKDCRIADLLFVIWEGAQGRS